jgi:hypothetical protein
MNQLHECFGTHEVFAILTSYHEWVIVWNQEAEAFVGANQKPALSCVSQLADPFPSIDDIITHFKGGEHNNEMITNVSTSQTDSVEDDNEGSPQQQRNVRGIRISQNDQNIGKILTTLVTKMSWASHKIPRQGLCLTQTGRKIKPLPNHLRWSNSVSNDVQEITLLHPMGNGLHGTVHLAGYDTSEGHELVVVKFPNELGEEGGLNRKRKKQERFDALNKLVSDEHECWEKLYLSEAKLILFDHGSTPALLMPLLVPFDLSNNGNWVCAALLHLLTNQVHHKDLKPQHFGKNSNGEIRVFDYGKVSIINQNKVEVVNSYNNFLRAHCNPNVQLN